MRGPRRSPRWLWRHETGRRACSTRHDRQALCTYGDLSRKTEAKSVRGIRDAGQPGKNAFLRR